MKKLLCILLISFLSVNCVACSTDEKQAEQKEEVKQEQEVKEETDQKEEQAEEKPKTEKEKIADAIKAREDKYYESKIDKIEVNDNLGTDEKEDYIVLVYMSLDHISEKTGTKNFETFADDISANLHNEGFKNVKEVCVFCNDEYHNRKLKRAYEHKDDGFYLTDTAQ